MGETSVIMSIKIKYNFKKRKEREIRVLAPSKCSPIQCRMRNTHSARSFHGETRGSGHEEVKIRKERKKSHEKRWGLKPK